MAEQVIDGYMRVICLDGPRKGREYYFRDNQREFGITSLVPGSAEAAFNGAPLSGYGQYIYKVIAVWGLSFAWKTYSGEFVRLAYK